MVTLTRTVRYCINPGPASGPSLSAAAQPDGVNGYAGKPAMQGLGRYYEFDVRCTGAPDPQAGYLINIKTIDHAVRVHAIPIVEQLCIERPDADPARELPQIAAALARSLPVRLAALAWRLTPTYALEVTMSDTQAPAPTVTLRQRFDFAAAHRLHCPDLTDEQNRETFGKCNNPSGHGHNYQVEPCVEFTPGSFSLADLERLTDMHIIEHLDHKHLNEDTQEFGSGGLNPSVEHIARVCYDRLDRVLRGEFPSARLRSLTVWETDRTSATVEG